MQEKYKIWIQSLDREDPLEEETATHSSILAWRIPWTEKAWRATVPGVTRVGHDLATKLPGHPGSTRLTQSGWGRRR